MNGSDSLKYILFVLPFALMCLATFITNLKKEWRGHQFPSMFTGLIYSVIAIVGYNQFSNRVLAFIKSAALKIVTFGKTHPQFQETANSIAKKIMSVDWNLYLVFIANFLLLTLYLIIKRVALPIYKKTWKNESLYNSTSGMAYEWNEALSIYCLKNNFFAVKKLQKVYYIITCLIACSLLALIKMNPKWPGFKGIMYPFAVVIIVGEIFFFLDGKTAAEYKDTFAGSAGSSRRHALYYPFARYLGTAFADRLIDFETRFSNYLVPHNNHDIVKKFENIDTQEGRIANIYFHKKATARDYIDTEDPDNPLNSRLLDPSDRTAVKLDEGLVDATFRLMNGESVLFATPFYKDYTEYIFLPINRALMRDGKVLFILGRNGIDKDIKNWITEALERAINIPEMWKIGKLESGEAFDGDVGIVNAADVFAGEVINKNLPFINKVTEVVMLEPSQFISTAQLSISVYVKNVNEKATYYIFDKNNDGLIDSLSHIIRKSLVSVTPSNRERNISTYMLWEADGDHLSHRLFPSVARYLGVGTELMIAALKEQIRTAEWYGYNKFPLEEMHWISHQYYPTLCDYASLPQREEELESRMKFNHNMWSAGKEEYKYLVVEDEFCNLYETARQFSFRGTKETFVNVIAQNYMFRDYMQYNSTLFNNDPKAVPTFVPDYARTQRNIILELLLKLYSAPLEEEEIVAAFRYIGLNEFFEDYKSYQVKETLYSLILDILPFEGSCSMEGLIDERDGTYRIRTRDDDQIKYTVEGLRCVYYITEDEKEKSHYLDAKLYGQVYQSHLPTQHVVIGGKYYEILLIGSEKGVVLKRAGDHIHNREYYRQLRTYDISAFEPDTGIGSHSTFGRITVDKGLANIEVSTDGYLLLDDYGNLCDNCFTKVLSGVPKRYYKRKSALRLTLNGVDVQTRETIALLFNELFKTVYPDSSDFICAVTVTESDVPKGLLYGLTSFEEDDASIYIIEDSTLDMGLISSVQRNLRRFFEAITDYLDWYEEALEPIPVTDDTNKVELDDELVNKAINNTVNDKPKKKTFIEKLKGLFKRKKKKGAGEEETESLPGIPDSPENPTVGNEPEQEAKPVTEEIEQTEEAPAEAETAEETEAVPNEDAPADGEDTAEGEDTADGAIPDEPSETTDEILTGGEGDE